MVVSSLSVWYQLVLKRKGEKIRILVFLFDFLCLVMLDGEEWELRVSDTRVPHSDSSDSFRDSEVLRVADTRVPHIIHPGDLELRVTDTRVPYNIF